MHSGVCWWGFTVLLLIAPSAWAQAPSGPSGQSGLEDLTGKGFKDPVGLMNDIYQLSEKGSNLLNDVHPLTEDDKSYDPPADPAGQPKLPSVCKGNWECAECFAGPYQNLQDVRVRFERLRRTYASTKKMITDAVAFGDGVSAVHGVAALGWSRQKQKIRQSEKNFESAYDAKYLELLRTLEEALRGIGACEQKVFGEEAWYDRYGFMLYQFLADRYQRAG